MSPLELQLYRELAIQMVRLCAERLQQDGAAEPPDLNWYHRWFDLTFDAWLSTPRTELGGRTPGEALRDEQAQLAGCAVSEPGGAEPQYIELYTDLPQAEEVTERIELGDPDGRPPTMSEPLDAPARGPDRGEAAGQPGPAPAASRSAADEVRWRAFYDRFLAGWLDETP